MRSGETTTHVSFRWAQSGLVWRIVALTLAIFLAGMALSARVTAQDLPPQRQLRTFIPPDQIVSFLPTTPFDQFLDNLNPIFIQVTGKRVIDPESRQHQIGVSVVGMQFFDAFELVLEMYQLSYRETERYFIIEPAPEPSLGVDRATTDALARRPVEEVVATAWSREIEIEAVLFEIDHTNTRQLGIDWTVFWGEQAGSGGSEGQFFLKTEELFEPFESWLRAPAEIAFTDLNQFFRLTEATGLGHTVASPKITVVSGEQGRIQIGSDIPIQVRDFAGNTITQFVSTGIIINVTPTLIASPVADTLGAPLLEFIHLDVRVERSTGRPFAGSVAVERAGADTDVLLLNGEMTVIAGLYGTEEIIDRAGIPILKDLPWWFFGLRYIFGKETKTVSKGELLIVLRATALDPLPVRAERPFATGLRDRQRQQVYELLRRLDERATEMYWPDMLKPYDLQQQNRNQDQPGDE